MTNVEIQFQSPLSGGQKHDGYGNLDLDLGISSGHLWIYGQTDLYIYHSY